MSVFYASMVKVVTIFHLGIVAANLVAIPLMILNEPFWLWMPLITFLVSPMLGGTYCMFNRLENYFRAKAGMRLIQDRLQELFNWRD